MSHVLKQYDHITLKWRAKVDFSGADSIRFLMNSATRPTPPVVDKPAVVDPDDDFVLVVTLESHETAVPGKYNVEFETMWPDGQIITLPGQGYERVTIVPDLGGHLEESE